MLDVTNFFVVVVTKGVTEFHVGEGIVWGQVVCKEARNLRGGRARRPRSPQWTSRSTGEGVKSLVHGTQKSQATSLGYQGAELLSRHLQYTSLAFRTGSFTFCLAPYLATHTLSSPWTLKILKYHYPSEFWSFSHLYLRIFSFFVYLLCKTVSFWKAKAWASFFFNLWSYYMHNVVCLCLCASFGGEYPEL